MKTMTLYRPNALSDFFERANTLNDFDRFFESCFGSSPLVPSARTFNRPPAVDIKETEKAYVLEMELPGFGEKDIEVHIDGSHLSISSKREEVKEEKEKDSAEGQGSGATWLLKERRLSSFSRTFKLPENANPDEVTADFKNGVLRMEINKQAEAQKRMIPINVK